MKNKYDVVIVGMGPAGSSAAYFSKYFDTNGIKRVLAIESLENEHFTRYHHMCGEVVSKYIKNDFPDINVADFAKNRIRSFIEYWTDEVEYKSSLSGYVIDRPKYLRHLHKQFKKMGGEIIQDKVISYEQKTGSIKVLLRNNDAIKTKYLIIATGPKRLEGNVNIEGDFFSTLLYQILIKNYPIENNCVKFYYDEKYKEDYKWVFPYGDLVKICLPLRNKDELAKYGNDYEILRKDIKHVCCDVLKNYCVDNVIFIGDAAYQNNPLTKGGIRPAINAGKMAGESLIKYDDPSRYNLLWKNSGFFPRNIYPLTKN